LGVNRPLLALPLVALLLAGMPAHDDARATVPGRNGRIAFAAWHTDGSGDILTMSRDGGEQMNVTNDYAMDYDPQWSPDGFTIAFTSPSAGGDYDVFVTDADGAGRMQLTNNDYHDGRPTWSPDG
jgi:Tol biopolymer transport system component